MKNHLSVNHFCLSVAVAAVLVGTVARAQNPPAPAPQVAPAKAPDSLSIYFDPGSAAVTAQGQTTLIRPLALIETVNRSSWWLVAAPIPQAPLPLTFGYRNSEPTMCCRSGRPRHSGRAFPDTGNGGN